MGKMNGPLQDRPAHIELIGIDPMKGGMRICLILFDISPTRDGAEICIDLLTLTPQGMGWRYGPSHFLALTP